MIRHGSRHLKWPGCKSSRHILRAYQISFFTKRLSCRPSTRTFRSLLTQDICKFLVHHLWSVRRTWLGIGIVATFLDNDRVHNGLGGVNTMRLHQQRMEPLILQMET